MSIVEIKRNKNEFVFNCFGLTLFSKKIDKEEDIIKKNYC